MAKTLQDIADSQHHTTLTTAGWKMPVGPEPLIVMLYIASPEWIEAEAKRRNLPLHTAGFTMLGTQTAPAGVFVPPLNTVEDMELWRHELRHAIEGDWHSRKAIGAASMPRGIRTDNPGNLRRTADSWRGLAAEQTDPEFFQFSEPKWGLRAIARTLITYQDKRGLKTVRAMIERWAPPEENDTLAYIAAVCRALGCGQDDEINVHDFATMRNLVMAIVLQENGRQPYPPALIDAALELAGVEPRAAGV